MSNGDLSIRNTNQESNRTYENSPQEKNNNVTDDKVNTAAGVISPYKKEQTESGKKLRDNHIFKVLTEEVNKEIQKLKNTNKELAPRAHSPRIVWTAVIVACIAATVLMFAAVALLFTPLSLPLLAIGASLMFAGIAGMGALYFTTHKHTFSQNEKKIEFLKQMKIDEEFYNAIDKINSNEDIKSLIEIYIANNISEKTKSFEDALAATEKELDFLNNQILKNSQDVNKKNIEDLKQESVNRLLKRTKIKESRYLEKINELKFRYNVK